MPPGGVAADAPWPGRGCALGARCLRRSAGAWQCVPEGWTGDGGAGRRGRPLDQGVQPLGRGIGALGE